MREPSALAVAALALARAWPRLSHVYDNACRIVGTERCVV